jgi:hypothetical protein
VLTTWSLSSPVLHESRSEQQSGDSAVVSSKMSASLAEPGGVPMTTATKATRILGFGSIFRSSYKDRHGETKQATTWTLDYRVPGELKPRRESAHTDDRRQAMALLRQRCAEYRRADQTTPEVRTVNVTTVELFVALTNNAEQASALQRIAKKEGIPLSAQVESAVRRWLADRRLGVGLAKARGARGVQPPQEGSSA